MFRFLLILILSLCWSNSAYSLPKCKGSPIKNYRWSSEQEALVDKWNNCYGQVIYEDGGGYEGGYRNGSWHGIGHYFNPKTKKVPYKRFATGEWDEGFLLKVYGLIALIPEIVEMLQHQAGRVHLFLRKMDDLY